MTTKSFSSRPGSKSPAGNAKGGSAGDIERLSQIFKLMEQYQVGDLEWERGGERLHIRAKGAAQHGSAPMAHAATHVPVQPVHALAPVAGSYAAAPEGAAAHSAASPAPKAAAAASANVKQITSPFVGTFYRSPSPTAQAYAKEGQVVKKGDVVCIIEAMKLMNEIESELSGKIVAVLVENGQPVEFGEPLFTLEA